MTLQRYEIGEGAFGTFAHLRVLSCTFLHFYLHTDLTDHTDMIFLMYNFLSGFSEIIKNGADLARGEILAMGVIADGGKLLAELGNAVDPTHQVACGGARVAGREIEHCKLLFAITSYFHFLLKNKIKNISSLKNIIFSNHPVPLSKEGSTFSPSPSSSGSGDVAGDAIALPEFWYRQRSLCPKGLPMISYAIELRLFVRCYTALLTACLLVAGDGIGLCPRRWAACGGYRWEIADVTLRVTIFSMGVTRGNDGSFFYFV